MVGKKTMLPASAASAHRPSCVGVHGSDSHWSDRIWGGAGLRLYCIPRCVMRRKELRRRRLYIVPWFHGIGFDASPKSRKGNASLLMVMKGIWAAVRRR